MASTTASDNGSDRYDAVIVGAGFSGLFQLFELRRRGHRVHLVEANGGPGGVWWANRYPGARVDSHVPNYEYSLEAVWRGWTWSERFPGGEEIRRYFRHVEDVLGLGSDISYDTRVTDARLDDDGGAGWSIGLDGARAGRIRADHLILCTGFASKPYVPAIPGLDRFEGPCHHTARWPHDGLDLAGRRVGVIGTGASGVQVVQEATKVAGSLTVFQRTPVTALPMQQRPLDPVVVAEAKADYPAVFATRNNPPGSMHDIVRRGKSAVAATAEEREAVFTDAWNEGGFHFWAATFADVGSDLRANRMAYDFWRDRTRARLDDPAVADLLAPMEPPYPFGTKRPSLEQDYYECFNQPHVRLVDLRADPITEVTPSGVRCGAEHHDLDVLVLATGFDANTGGLTEIDIRGTDGRTMAERWADGVDTTLGIALSGFPNLFFLYGPQSPASFCNGPTCAELQSQWLADLLDHVRERGATRVESTPEADRAWSAHLEEVAAGSLLAETDSWYMAANIPGKRRQLLNYPNSDAYLEALARCAAAGYDQFVID
ncbi:MAG: NAD(P)/FAD-dependent oxidoreductase [Actinomycetota bacterium]